MPSEGIPYPLFSYSGLLLWLYFSNSISTAGNSLVSNQNLVSKYISHAIDHQIRLWIVH
jgi:lipopolysaccharide transport system permease protein